MGLYRLRAVTSLAVPGQWTLRSGCWATVPSAPPLCAGWGGASGVSGLLAAAQSPRATGSCPRIYAAPAAVSLAVPGLPDPSWVRFLTLRGFAAQSQGAPLGLPWEQRAWRLPAGIQSLPSALPQLGWTFGTHWRPFHSKTAERDSGSQWLTIKRKTCRNFLKMWMKSAYIKLGDYRKALTDCDWALKCDEKCTKAYFHMGKAHLALKNYSESRECYQKILEINPQLQTQVKGYLNQVDLREKADLQEKEAQDLLDSGKDTAVTTKNLLETLSKPDQIPLFYAGGIEILTEMMKDCAERTLFRTHNGFSIISDNEVIRRCLSTAGKDAVEETVCVSVLRLWQAVCSENEENQRLLVMHPTRGQLLPALLASRVPTIQEQSLALLLQLAQTENGRGLIISHLDLTRLLEALVSFLDFSEKKANSAMALLTDLALEERFHVWFQASLPGALPALAAVLKRDPRVTSTSALCQCIAILGNLSAEPAARRQLFASEEFGDACLGLMAKCEEDMDLFREVMYTLLGLMMNLCLQPSLVSEVWAMEVSRKCLSLLNSPDGGILTRAAGVLSRTLSSSLTIVEEALRAGVVKKMIKFLKAGGQTASRYAIKILAICTNSYHEAREEVIRLDKKLSVLMQLLGSEDEILVGNAALCLGNCMEVPLVASSLLTTDIVQVLLRLAGGDAQKTAVQLNAGIALGKLCTAEPRFAALLRELHGMEILNSTMKHVDRS
uniref:Tetratricopeptide repeat domain 12 n=1 Tax=Sus scrofa TaxID=9823 RepID=A0A5G2QV09_PIG